MQILDQRINPSQIFFLTSHQIFSFRITSHVDIFWWIEHALQWSCITLCGIISLIFSLFLSKGFLATWIRYAGFLRPIPFNTNPWEGGNRRLSSKSKAYSSWTLSTLVLFLSCSCFRGHLHFLFLFLDWSSFLTFLFI